MAYQNTSVCEVCEKHDGSRDGCVCGKSHKTCTPCYRAGKMLSLTRVDCIGATEFRIHWTECPLRQEVKVMLAIAGGGA
jgi:hypothetical protein